MPLSFSDVGNKIADDLDNSGKKVITYSWPDFYKINNAATIREARKDEILEFCFEEHDILIAYGNKVVVACKDKHINRVSV